MKACAAALHVLRFNFSAMGFDNGVDNGETHSQTVLFGSKELVEEMFVNLVGNTHAAITHTHPNAAVAVSLRCNFHVPPAGWNIAHRITGIGDQIDQHLVDLDRIAFYHGQILPE